MSESKSTKGSRNAEMARKVVEAWRADPSRTATSIAKEVGAVPTWVVGVLSTVEGYEPTGLGRPRNGDSGVKIRVVQSVHGKHPRTWVGLRSLGVKRGDRVVVDDSEPGRIVITKAGAVA